MQENAHMRKLALFNKSLQNRNSVEASSAKKKNIKFIERNKLDLRKSKDQLEAEKRERKEKKMALIRHNTVRKIDSDYYDYKYRY